MYLWTIQWKECIFFAMTKGINTDTQKSEVLQGTLDLMVLKVLEALGPQHGYGIARRIEQVSEQVLQLNEGTVYTSLLRLQQRGWIASDWGTSENNRKAKYYSITKSGRKQLARETENWERIAGVIAVDQLGSPASRSRSPLRLAPALTDPVAPHAASRAAAMSSCAAEPRHHSLPFGRYADNCGDANRSRPGSKASP